MDMLIATTEHVGHEVQETLGEVFGIAVRGRGLVGNVLAGLKTIIGGEIHQYTAMLQTARQHAVDRMVAEAQLKGADAIVMMRCDSGEIAQGTPRCCLRHGGEAQACGMSRLRRTGSKLSES